MITHLITCCLIIELIHQGKVNTFASNLLVLVHSFHEVLKRLFKKCKTKTSDCSSASFWKNWIGATLIEK